ncbi:MAG: SpoIID/LytB domain-containing protein [Defluviitaleaceae bacterium]|nr:SpoIID/LytB domain-containing protein [Defluviitaleaceae bacterium]MCL2262661.1 SpoIID/LytB domain-containing protein [Defluviitaleaceae bacterium]
MKKFFCLCLLFLALTACGQQRREDIGGALPILSPTYYGNYGASFFAPTYIRVVIGTSNFEGLIHESPQITATGAFFVERDGNTTRFGAGEVFCPVGKFPTSEYIAAPINSSSNLGAAIPPSRGVVGVCTANFNRGVSSASDTRRELPEVGAEGTTTDPNAASTLFRISTESPYTRLKILNLARNWQNNATPQYRGVFEISQRENGFVIVNELPLEEYLYAVVPSEMPSAHGVEASKVQAVTARTFAYHQMREERFRDFGAHVDDSVISQVYNNIPENEIAIEAVRATRGQILTFNGEIILANYFSTSGGTTANFGEVWAVGETFPSYTPEFLRARAQMLTYHPGNLRTEEAASAFFRNTEVPAFDRQFPWFRWQVTMTAQELSHRINTALHTRQTANPTMIHMLNAYGAPTAAPAHSIGTLQHMEVTRRGQGGNIMEMLFRGTEGVVRVQTEFNIRTLLNPAEIPVTRHDGTTSGTLTLLPSAFFTFDTEYDANGNLQSVTIFGGGNGHGVGKSQNGVRALLDMGLTYVEILRHYYPGTEITFTSTMSDIIP